MADIGDWFSEFFSSACDMSTAVEDCADIQRRNRTGFVAGRAVSSDDASIDGDVTRLANRHADLHVRNA